MGARAMAVVRAAEAALEAERQAARDEIDATCGDQRHAGRAPAEQARRDRYPERRPVRRGITSRQALSVGLVLVPLVGCRAVWLLADTLNRMAELGRPASYRRGRYRASSCTSTMSQGHPVPHPVSYGSNRGTGAWVGVCAGRRPGVRSRGHPALDAGRLGRGRGRSPITCAESGTTRLAG